MISKLEDTATKAIYNKIENVINILTKKKRKKQKGKNKRRRRRKKRKRGRMNP